MATELTASQLLLAANLASEAAQQAGALIAATRPTRVEHKEGGSSLASQVVTDVDRAAERLIVGRLAQFEAAAGGVEVGLLTEETPDDGSRWEADCFWCVDPLDGTLAFTRGDPGYAVSIGLVARSGEPLVGVVVDPVRGVSYRAVRRGEVVREGPRPAKEAVRAEGAAGRLRVCFDRSMAEPSYYDGGGSAGYGTVVEALEEAAAEHGLEGVDITLGAGGAVLNACHVLDAPQGCYFKFPKAEPGGGSVWDFAATACLFETAGAYVTDMAGERLQLNPRETTFMNRRGVMMASDEVLANRIRRRLERLNPGFIRL